MQMNELETLIDQRAKAKAEEVMKGLDVGSVVDAKCKETIENKVKEVYAQAEKDKQTQANILDTFVKANAENEVKENAVSTVNKMLAVNLKAMQKFGKKNVAEVNKDEFVETAKELFPNSKAFQNIIENKDLNTTVPTAGGFTVPLAFSADYIEALYKNSILDKLGVSRIPLPNGNLSIPKMTASATAYWVGESKKITKSEATFGNINLKAKKLGALCPVSNDLLKFSGVGIEAWIMNDLREKANEKLNDALLNGSGSEYQPLGLLGRSIQTDSGVIGADTPFALEELLEKENIPMANVKWLLSPKGKKMLRSVKNGDTFAWADEMRGGNTIDGYSYITSGHVADADASHGTVILGDWSQLLWGVGYDLTFEMSRDASFDNGGGSTINCFENDLTLIKLITSHDFATKHDKAFAKGSYTAS